MRDCLPGTRPNSRERVTKLRRELLHIDDFRFVDDPGFPHDLLDQEVEVPSLDGEASTRVTMLSLAARALKPGDVAHLLYKHADANAGDPPDAGGDPLQG
jgi:hypothetical protein